MPLIVVGFPARPAYRLHILEMPREVVIMEIKTAGLKEPPKTHTKNTPLKKGPRAQSWHMIIGGIAVLFYLFWLGDRLLGPPQPYESSKTREDKALAANVSAQAGPTGDLSKVNPEDRQEFLNMMGGSPVSPRSVLVNVWKSNHQSAQTKMRNFWQSLVTRLHWFP
jgi:hypothetical protein